MVEDVDGDDDAVVVLDTGSALTGAGEGCAAVGVAAVAEAGVEAGADVDEGASGWFVDAAVADDNGDVDGGGCGLACCWVDMVPFALEARRVSAYMYRSKLL